MIILAGNFWGPRNGAMLPTMRASVYVATFPVALRPFNDEWPQLTDECLLWQVLLACVKCPGGQLLSHKNILSIFQACFRIGHYQTERSKDMSGAQCPFSWGPRLHVAPESTARLPLETSIHI